MKVIQVTNEKPWCPLENTKLEMHCKNEANDPKFRSSKSICGHIVECFDLKVDLLYNIKNRW